MKIRYLSMSNLMIIASMSFSATLISSFEIQRSTWSPSPQMYVKRKGAGISQFSPLKSSIAGESPSGLGFDANADSATRSSKNKEVKARNDVRNKDDLDLPWGDSQEWALTDNIGKYIVQIPQLNKDGGINNEDDDTDAGSNPCEYAMWRSLTRDVIELAGYDVEFIRKKYVQSKRDDEVTVKAEAPGVLPLLDNFEFQSNGGLSGQIQGLRGIADGTTVQTSSLAHVQLTVPRGYVLTEDLTSAYELGLPLSGAFEENSNTYSLDIAKMKDVDVDGVANSLKSGVAETGKMAGSIAKTVAGDQETTTMLVNLGATTGILLGGALAVNMLSHHLTVNMFWV